jgi:Flp pilus assembly protein TadB
MTVVVLGMLTLVALGAVLAPRPVPRRAFFVDGGSIRRRSRLPRLARGRPRSSIEPSVLAAWCDALARALRGGATLRHALSTVDPPASVAPHLAPALLALGRGASVAAALADVDARSRDLDLVLVVMRACAEHGGGAAEPIDRAAAALRQRAALAGERRTNSAQARMSAVVMTCLPLAMLVLLALTSRSVRAAATSAVGLAVIGVGIMLNLAGWGWMRGLIARATR